MRSVSGVILRVSGGFRTPVASPPGALRRGPTLSVPERRRYCVQARRAVQGIALMGAVAVLSTGCLLYERGFSTDPYSGKMVPGPTVRVGGDLPMDFPIQGTLKVNGQDVAYGALPQRHWAADVPQD